MSKQPSITEIVTLLEEENSRLKGLEKDLDRTCKNFFGYGIKEIKKMISSYEKYEARKAIQQGQRNHTEHSEE